MVDFAGANSPPTASNAPTTRKANRAGRVAASGLLWGCMGVCALLLFVAGLGLVRLLQWLW